jgi:hypothetical protein
VTSFLHWNEKTSTSPSGRHLGLYQSIVTVHIDSGSEFDASTPDSQSVNSKATMILHAIHDVATCVAERGLYLDRWIYVVNAMIYKKAGVLELDELRVIHLFEADFNLLVGLVFGRRTVHNAVDHKKLHPSQFGKKVANAWTLSSPKSCITLLQPTRILLLVSSRATQRHALPG